jgi:hypothetical protein
MDFVPRKLTHGGIPCVSVYLYLVTMEAFSVNPASSVRRTSGAQYPTNDARLGRSCSYQRHHVITSLFDTTRQKKNTKGDEEGRTNESGSSARRRGDSSSTTIKEDDQDRGLREGNQNTDVLMNTLLSLRR